jgi:hypothetical protein
MNETTQKLDAAPEHECPYCQPWMTMLAALRWRAHTYDAAERKETLEQFWACVTGPDFAALRWPTL